MLSKYAGGMFETTKGRLMPLEGGAPVRRLLKARYRFALPPPLRYAQHLRPQAGEENALLTIGRIVMSFRALKGGTTLWTI